ncbi:protein draper-like [Saccostrea cucullata]|uniref:protein draper-like n=1 Tax=Saccostrea cuccullata TaxID=36930 RepID=UPI002ED53242
MPFAGYLFLGLIFHYVQRNKCLRCDGPNGTKCCSGFQWNVKLGNCIECKAGYMGENCFYKCASPYYGRRCLQKCNCQGKMCHFITGCNVLKTNTTEYTSVKVTRSQRRRGIYSTELQEAIIDIEYATDSMTSKTGNFNHKEKHFNNFETISKERIEFIYRMMIGLCAITASSTCLTYLLICYYRQGLRKFLSSSITHERNLINARQSDTCLEQNSNTSSKNLYNFPACRHSYMGTVSTKLSFQEDNGRLSLKLNMEKENHAFMEENTKEYLQGYGDHFKFEEYELTKTNAHSQTDNYLTPKSAKIKDKGDQKGCESYLSLNRTIPEDGKIEKCDAEIEFDDLK